MNVYENIRNTIKMVEKLSRVCPTFPKCQLLIFEEYQTCYQIKLKHYTLTQ